MGRILTHVAVMILTAQSTVYTFKTDQELEYLAFSIKSLRAFVSQSYRRCFYHLGN